MAKAWMFRNGDEWAQATQSANNFIAEHYPRNFLLNLEVWYNKLDLFSYSLWLYIAATFLVGLFFFGKLADALAAL